MTLRGFVKELTPPILIRLIRTLRSVQPQPQAKSVANGKGKERGPGWYDQRFLANETWRKHYTESHYYPLWILLAYRVMHVGVQSILDIGCGPGQVAMLLRDRGFPKYLGIDFSPERLRWARKVCPEYDFLIADAFETDLYNRHDYDAVICTEMLEHVNSDLAIVESIRPGTYLFSTVPNFPDKGHVRHFRSAEEVAERYEMYFDAFDIFSILSNTQGVTYYYFEGIKRHTI